jgi:type II secretion system protein J
VRAANAGVTLIEMLVALGVSALIGLAGFILLDSVTGTEARVADRLSILKDRERAFHLLGHDMRAALSHQFQDGLRLDHGDRVVTWRASDEGLERHLEYGAGGGRVVQQILQEPARFEQIDPLAVLHLPQSAVERLFVLP